MKPDRGVGFWLSCHYQDHYYILVADDKSKDQAADAVRGLDLPDDVIERMLQHLDTMFVLGGLGGLTEQEERDDG